MKNIRNHPNMTDGWGFAKAEKERPATKPNIDRDEDTDERNEMNKSA